MLKSLLFSDCQPIKGYLRSIVYDLGREDFSFIPNIVFNNLSNRTTINISEEYFCFLNSKDYIFEIESDGYENMFPPINLSFNSPSIITNSIIDINEENFKQINSIIKVLINELNTKSVVFRFLSMNQPVSEIIQLLQPLEDSKIDTIDVLINKNRNHKNILSSNKRIKSLIFYDCFENKFIEGSSKIQNVQYFKKKLSIETEFIIKPSFFNVNIDLFTESQKHHTYFNRKLYIGSTGEIKNAPECVESFGNIQDIKDAEELKQLIAQSSFQKYWFVHKELCDVCKDCEFRHMCVDNRLPYQRKDGSWYHQIECNYNPYICKWQGEEGYQTLAECGVITNEKGYSRDDEKIAAINEKLWAD